MSRGPTEPKLSISTEICVLYIHMAGAISWYLYNQRTFPYFGLKLNNTQNASMTRMSFSIYIVLKYLQADTLERNFLLNSSENL